MRHFLYCLIFPHPHNNHRPKFLHFKTLVMVISLLIISSFLFSSGTNPLTQKIQALADISSQELLKYTNEKRLEHGLPALVLDKQLEDAAYAKAEDMFLKDYWAHNSPDGTTPWYFITNAGYAYVYAGENLAKGFTDSRDVVNAWMASPSHKENLLSDKFTEVGFAVKAGSLGGEETFLVVQELGNRTASTVEKIADIPPPEETETKVLSVNLESISSRQAKSISYDFIALIILSFIVILLVDMLIINRKNIARFVGHNMDHVLFLMAVLIVITIMGTGFIL
jgi:uncharacterized protein YkwD